MAPPAGAKYRALIAACLLILAESAFADDVRLRLPTQDAAGGDAPIGLPPQGRDADITALSVDMGVGETDNILRTGSNGQSQTIALVGVDFDLKRVGTRIDADLKGDFNYIDYVENAFGKQLLGRFDGTADYVLIPEHLRWALDDSFGQSQLDPLAAVTPNNIENVNVVSTGPDLTLHPGQSLFVKIGARYVYSQYETSPFDNNRILANASIGRDLSVASDVSANADFQRIRFNNTDVNTDYDRRNFYGKYSVLGGRTALTFELGASQADDTGVWKTTPFARIEATRTLSAASLLQFSAGRQYSDISDSFRGLQSGATGRIVVAPVTGTTANYLDEYATLLWKFERNRTTFDATAGWEKDTYAAGVVNALDVSRATAEVRVARRMTSTLTAELSGRAAREQFFGQGFSDNDYLGSVALGYRPARRFEFKLRFDHEARIASGDNAIGFIENRAMLTVGYRFKP